MHSTVLTYKYYDFACQHGDHFFRNLYRWIQWRLQANFSLPYQFLRPNAARPVARGGAGGQVHPPFHLKGGCAMTNVHTPPPIPYKYIVSHNFLKSSCQLYSPSKN